MREKNQSSKELRVKFSWIKVGKLIATFDKLTLMNYFNPDKVDPKLNF